MSAIDDIHEGSTKRGASHQEAVDIRLSVKIAGIGSGGGAAIDNSRLVGNSFRDILCEPCADIGMGGLSLRGSSSDSSSDGPNRLISLIRNRINYS